MITADGWFDWAVREPGPADKVYSQRNTVQRLVPHDAVGYKAGWYSRLFATEKYLDPVLGWRYTPYAATSQHGIILDEIDPKTGDAVFIEHYPIWASCWGSGSREINCSSVCWEQERIRGNFNALWLPDHMIRTNIRLFGDLYRHMKWRELRRPRSVVDKDAQCYRHSECGRFGADPTACDSKRTPHEAIIQAVLQEDEMAERVWCAERQRTYIVGKFGAAPVVYPEDDKVWQSLYGPHTRVMTGAELDALAPK